MFKYEIEYENSEGNKVKENLYFNLTKAEVIKMDLMKNGKLANILQEIIDSQNAEQTIIWFDKIIRLAYGQKTSDGLFKKDPELTDAFIASEAYSEFFIKLIRAEIDVNAFVLGILPKEVAAEVVNQLENK